MKLTCDYCGKEIKTDYFESENGVICCNKCIDKELNFEDEFEAYIHQDQAQNYNFDLDNYGEDVDKFYIVSYRKKFYVEIYDKSCYDVIIVQSKWFDSKRKAINWFKKHFDFVNKNYGCRLMCAYFRDDELDGDVLFDSYLK